jgi:hypothetical protein
MTVQPTQQQAVRQAQQHAAGIVHASQHHQQRMFRDRPKELTVVDAILLDKKARNVENFECCKAKNLVRIRCNVTGLYTRRQRPCWGWQTSGHIWRIRPSSELDR